MLELKNLYKKYQRKDVWAVKNLSLQVPKGELLALVGESGSGKTTLLRMIAGFEVPDQGTISLNGREVFGPAVNVQPENRRIGMVFQDYALFPHLRVRDNILFGLQKAKKNVKQGRLEELLELVGLQTQAHKYPHELSGGQQQRVALARALAPQPDILLLDEPFSNLDEVLKEQMRSDMRHIIKNTSITAIFVTHDTRDALTTADRIVILKDGSMHQAGSPHEVYESPANTYVAGFFGQVNLLPATPTPTGYQTALGKIEATSPLHQHSESYLCLRPEHLELCLPEEALFQGTVKEQMYLGSHQRIRLQVAELLLVLDLPASLDLRPGTKISCRIKGELLNSPLITRPIY